MTSNPIFFWLQGELPYGCFSQWYSSEFKDKDGLVWKNVEQFFMAMKAKTFGDLDTYNKLRLTSDPRQCKSIGRQVSSLNENKWRKKAMMVAYIGNMMKFEQNPDLKRLLLSTGSSPLYEASPFDFIWGIGLSAHTAKELNEEEYPGLNQLGKTLMKVRATIASQQMKN